MDGINLPGDAKQPMLHTACDLFSAVGKQWLALVDRFSGYAWITVLRRLDTKAVILHLENWEGGVPYPYMDRQMQYARNIYEYDTSVTEPRRRAHKHHVHS